MQFQIECTCGKIKGTAKSNNAKHTRAICLCDDCQAYAHYLGRAKEILDKNGGTDIFPQPPADIKITEGIENLKCMRLSDRGMFRWYAGCCKTPIANTMSNNKVPYHGMVHNIIQKKNDQKTLDDAFGPAEFRLQGKYGIGELPPGTPETVSPGFMFMVMKFSLRAILKGLKKPSPFFDQNDKPLAEPHVLSQAERDSLRPLCGPKS